MLRIRWQWLWWLIPLLAVLWFFRTWWHGIVMLVYAYPVLWEALLFWWLLHRVVLRRMNWRRAMAARDGNGSWLWVISASLLALLLALGVLASTWARGYDLATSLSYQKLDRLPESAVDVRLMPAEVAFRYAKDSLQLSQYRLGTAGIVLLDGKLTWAYPLTPDGLIIKFTKKNAGLMAVDATTQEKNARVVWQDLAVGEGMQLTDNLWWRLYRRRYFVDTEAPYYLVRQGQVFTVVPAIGYRYRLGPGFPYTVPYFAGVFLVDAGGKVDLLTPAQALEHPALKGNRVFPERLARTYVDAYQYHLGVWNRLFLHQDQPQIQDVERAEGETNRQPFLMATSEGLQWFVATEPYGESHGVFKVFLVDAATGEIGLYELPPDRTLTGPVRALDYVRRANPVVDWSRFELVEPLPFIRDGVLYWKLAVIPTDGAGIAYQAFVDSRNNDVVEAETDAQVRAFVQGQPLAPPPARTPREQLLQQVRQKLQELEELVRQLEGEAPGADSR